MLVLAILWLVAAEARKFSPLRLYADIQKPFQNLHHQQKRRRLLRCCNSILGGGDGYENRNDEILTEKSSSATPPSFLHLADDNHGLDSLATHEEVVEGDKAVLYTNGVDVGVEVGEYDSDNEIDGNINNDDAHDPFDSSISEQEQKQDEMAEKEVDGRRRFARDVVRTFLSDQGINQESYGIRHLISVREKETTEQIMTYLTHQHQLQGVLRHDSDGDGNGDEDEYTPSFPSHPKKLLHYIAPKIPAIKSSPDYMLRIQSARGNVDAGLAACCIGVIARVCKLYNKCLEKENGHQQLQDRTDNEGRYPTSHDIITDRRFEQLIECLLCGVDIKKRKVTPSSTQTESASEGQKEEGGGEGGETQVKENRQQERQQSNTDIQKEQLDDDGVSIRDACRAAWGIATLYLHQQVEETATIGGEKTKDLLNALALRTGERLLARLHMLQHGVLFQDDNYDEKADRTANDEDTKPRRKLPLRERIHRESEGLAQDAVYALWAFACVKSCRKEYDALEEQDGHYHHLLDACCTILCDKYPEYHHNTNYEVEDVVDRLANSEEEAGRNEKPRGAVLEENKLEERDDHNSWYDGEKQQRLLLDSLSPHEVKDALWAITLLDGRNDHNVSSSKNGTSMVSTPISVVTLLKDAAIDRLSKWLSLDLKMLRPIDTESNFGEATAPLNRTRGVFHLDEERIDAINSTGLSNEANHGMEVSGKQDNATSDSIDELVIGVNFDDSMNRTGANSSKTGYDDTREVEKIGTEVVSPLVNPAEIEEQVNNNSTESFSHVFTEARMDHKNSMGPATDVHQDSTGVPTPSTSNANEVIFSVDELCTIAFAVTELGDRSQSLIVDLISRIVMERGRSCVDELGGESKANLLWSIAKSDDEIPSALSVVKLVAESTLNHLKCIDDVRSASNSGNPSSKQQPRSSGLFAIFEPADLARCMWSIAVIGTANAEIREKEMNSLRDLANLALAAVGSKQSLFSSEDLARISWAFLELCESKDTDSFRIVGEILANIEFALLQWEYGQHSDVGVENRQKIKKSIQFPVTFFGRSRMSMPNQGMGGSIDDYDEDYENAEKSSLPLLRDLPIDPATLCKAAYAYAKLSRSQSYIQGSWTLIRVAARLLTSKNGRLLEECSLEDINRLCCACTICADPPGEDKTPLTRRFTIQVVKLLSDSYERQQQGKENFLAKASPSDLSMLYLALSKLGVRRVSSGESSHSAHRKLRLVTEKPFLTMKQMKSLNVSRLIDLLCGVVAIESDKSFLLSVLSELKERMPLLSTNGDFCLIVESLAKVHNVITNNPLCKNSSRGSSSNSAIPDGSDVVQKLRGEETIIPDTSIGESTGQDETEGENSPISYDVEILSLCTELLSAVAEGIPKRIASFTPTQIQRLLFVYVSLPFQADSMVDEIEGEVKSRANVLKMVASMSTSSKGGGGTSRSVEKLIRKAADEFIEASIALSSFGDRFENQKSDITSESGDEEEVDEEISAMKEGENVNEYDKATHSYSDEIEKLVDLVSCAGASTGEVATRMERTVRCSRVDIERSLKEAEQGAALEIGRCQEIIRCYRQIDFST